MAPYCVDQASEACNVASGWYNEAGWVELPVVNLDSHLMYTGRVYKDGVSQAREKLEQAHSDATNKQIVEWKKNQCSQCSTFNCQNDINYEIMKNDCLDRVSTEGTKAKFLAEIRAAELVLFDKKANLGLEDLKLEHDLRKKACEVAEARFGPVCKGISFQDRLEASGVTFLDHLKASRV